MIDAGATWTDERVELLKKLWTDGLSASQIAAELGNVTRNAVIGKVHRLGLSGRAKDAKPAGSAAAARPRKATRAPSAPAPIAPQPHSNNNVVMAPIPLQPVAQEPVGLCRGRPRHSDVRARDDHGSARVHVPLADGRPDEARVPLLRRPLHHGPALLHPSRPHRLPAGGRPQARAQRPRVNANCRREKAALRSPAGRLLSALELRPSYQPTSGARRPSRRTSRRRSSRRRARCGSGRARRGG